MTIRYFKDKFTFNARNREPQWIIKAYRGCHFRVIIENRGWWGVYTLRDNPNIVLITYWKKKHEDILTYAIIWQWWHMHSKYFNSWYHGCQWQQQQSCWTKVNTVTLYVHASYSREPSTPETWASYVTMIKALHVAFKLPHLGITGSGWGLFLQCTRVCANKKSQSRGC